METVVKKERGMSGKILAIIFMAVGGTLLVAGFACQHLFRALAPNVLRTIQFDPVLFGLIGLVVFIVGIAKIASRNKRMEFTQFSKAKVYSFLLNNAIILAMLVFAIVVFIINRKFLTVRAFSDILGQAVPKMFLALGVSFSLIIAGTDLSAGRIMGVASVVVATLVQKWDFYGKFWQNFNTTEGGFLNSALYLVLPILLALVVCGLFGLFNGFLVAQFKMHPFIATLATSVIAWGVNGLYFEKPPLKGSPIGGLRSDFTVIGTSRLGNSDFMRNILGADSFGGIATMVIYAIVACVVIWFILNKTTFGKNVYAVGGNPEAAKVSGVNSYLTILIVFVIGGLMYGMGGIIEAARTAGATSAYGAGFELDAIAACVVGGVSLTGGVGKIRGIITGVLTFEIIRYGLIFIGVSPWYQQIIKGLIIVVAVALDLAKYNKK